jgi:parallel beta-helix repeat protein
MNNLLYKFPFLIFHLSFGLLLLSAENNFAADYYFSSSKGNDNYTVEESQSSLTPWCSIQKLNEISNSLKPGDRIYFQRGDVFHGTIRLTRGGTRENPISFDAYGTGEMPIITSLVKVETWSHLGNGVYQSKPLDLESTNLKIVLIDDELKEVGRFPNFGDANGGYLTIESLNNDFSINGKDIPFDAKGGEIVIRKNQWIIDSYPIEHSKNGTVDFLNVGKSGYRPLEGFGYFIQNHEKTLDQMGEWSYSKNQKILSVYFGKKNPSESSVEIATSNYLLVTNFLVQNLSFKNLHFKGSNKNLINIEKSSNIAIDNFVMEYSGENAIYSYSTPDFSVKNSKIRYSLSGAIFFWHSTPRAIISGNEIEYSMPFQGMSKNSDLNGIGIYIAGNADNSQITRNFVIDSGYNGIHFGGNNSIVKNNLVDKFCLWKQDGGGIYMNSDGLANSNNMGREIVGNIVLNGVGASEGTNEDYDIAEGIYLDDNTTGVKVSENTVAHINGKGIYLHNTNSIEIVGNLIFNSEVQLKLVHDNLGNHVREIRIENNQFSSTRNGEILISISSINDDIDKIGFSLNNYFLNPYNRVAIFETKDPCFSRSKLRNLKNWSETFGFDKSSKVQEFNLQKYQIIQKDIIKAIDFNEDVKAISGIYNATSKWVRSSSNNGELKVTSNSSKSGLVYIQIGKVLAEETILVELDVQTVVDNQTFELFLENTFNANQEFAVSYFISSTIRKRVSIFLKSLIDSNEESIVFRAPPNLKELTMDNIKVSKVTRKENDDQIFFQFNASDEIAYFPLTGTFKNVKGQVFNDSVGIMPYQSVLLVRAY